MKINAPYLTKYIRFFHLFPFKAIQQASTHPSDDKLRSHYLQAEAQRYRMESELDNVRRRLDQSEGSRTALQSQVYRSSAVCLCLWNSKVDSNGAVLNIVR